MGFRRTAVNLTLRGILGTICRIEYREFFETLSRYQPLILAINHINFLEVPILASFGYPLHLTGLAKSETWKNPFFSFLFNTYKAIPIDRNSSFKESFQLVRQAIDNGFYVIVAPEGARSKDGILREGKAGIIQLALEANAPVLPVVHYGGERFWENFKRLRRTPFCIKAGSPFRIRFEGRPGRTERREILDEVMRQLARLLPEEKRGIYATHVNQECKYLEFI